MKQTVMLVILALIVIGVAGGIYGNEQQGAPKPEKEVELFETENRTEVVPNEAIEEGEQSAEWYLPYSSETLATALAGGGETILFFHASWCPTCRAFDKEATAYTGAVPEGLTILKIDYDSAKELRKEYRVIRQHTFIALNADATERKRFAGVTTLEGVLKEL